MFEDIFMNNFILLLITFKIKIIEKYFCILQKIKSITLFFWKTIMISKDSKAIIVFQRWKTIYLYWEILD